MWILTTCWELIGHGKVYAVLIGMEPRITLLLCHRFYFAICGVRFSSTMYMRAVTCNQVGDVVKKFVVFVWFPSIQFGHGGCEIQKPSLQVLFHKTDLI